MPTKQEVQESWDNWTDLCVTLREKCIMCNKGSYWDIHLLKIPEWVEFCLDCWEKHKDDKVYQWFEWWRTTFRIGWDFVEK